ncbi:hypothetical protein [Croceicoccus naphthovorans]|uniref:hypothetical protein n=1 Tax=Croceicoccus naphthovorans TaxID=1348774 RepID=UPI000AF30493|nr:hypothetical protein [Croceicoccus naphthovorans]
MGGIEGRDARMGNEARAIPQPDVAAVETAARVGELGVDVFAHRLSDEKARHSGDVGWRQDAEHFVEEGFGHPRERKAGEHCLTRGGQKGGISRSHRSTLQ